MKAWRRQIATSVSCWLKHLCSNSTMPASGRDFDSRLPTTSVVTCTVSPWKSGFGKRTSVMPRLAIVVPTVVSLTEMPIIRPSVKSEFISGWPHSVSVSQIMPVDVERLRVQGQAGEEHVVHLGDGAAERVVEDLRRPRNPRNKARPWLRPFRSPA